METYGGVGVWLHAFLTSQLDEGKQLALRSGHFNPDEEP
jgi:hypothetical protein